LVVFIELLFVFTFFSLQTQGIIRLRAAKLQQKLETTKHFGRKFAELLTFCYFLI